MEMVLQLGRWTAALETAAASPGAAAAPHACARQLRGRALPASCHRQQPQHSTGAGHDAKGPGQRAAGARLAFGGEPLKGHTIPEVYGAMQPTAVFVPLDQMTATQANWDLVNTELFGPFQAPAPPDPPFCIAASTCALSHLLSPAGRAQALAPSTRGAGRGWLR